MDWVKKNLGFVIALAVAVVLMGAGVWYLLGTKSEADGVDAELQAKNSQLDSLVQRPVYPDTANIQLAKEEEARVQRFIKEARNHFTERTPPEGLDTAGFKSHLEATITELTREAERAGVQLPDKGSSPTYGFTFDEQRKQLQLSVSSLPSLSAQLADIQSLCRILFDAKVPSIVSFKRAPVGTNESAGTGAFLTRKITTNSAMNSVSYPYEVVVQVFSQELAAVLMGLVEAPESFIVKTLNVERGNLDTPATSTAAMPMAMPGASPYARDPTLARRYGLTPGRYQGQPAVPQVALPTANRPGEVVLDEKPLRVTLGIELVKLLPRDKAENPGRPNAVN